MVISELIAFIGCGSAYSHVEVERGGRRQGGGGAIGEEYRFVSRQQATVYCAGNGAWHTSTGLTCRIILYRTAACSAYLQA